jgi:demethylmenaquinone methyltransferase / 2-methoxy-6-polyprenyl-1,4-benzoquinol methylase
MTTEALGSGGMFDKIAHRYDLLNRVISLGIDQRWRRMAVAALDDLPGHIRVLDLASGTGDLAFAVQSHRGDSCDIIATDPSANMLAIADTKLAKRSKAQRDSLRFEVGDAQHLQFADASFDAVTMSFGIRNVPDRQRALAEMRRVTRPGGKVVILELSEPPPGIMGTAARIHVHHIVPRVGALLSGSKEYRYLQQSIAAFPSPEEFCRQISAAGMIIERSTALTFGACHLFVARVPGGAM